MVARGFCVGCSAAVWGKGTGWEADRQQAGKQCCPPCELVMGWSWAAKASLRQQCSQRMHCAAPMAAPSFMHASLGV
jgi:hypothetical protein